MLTRLELFGFKSFADRTAFDFVPGITCVVGPNGSGKSNVVDAIKWLLGDQSPKSLRGKEMSDVIFNGAAGRKGSGFAEATLTFDNTEGRLAAETSEVHVGRRLFRSGESEYLLNGNVVRLKDVRDVFMGTGAGTSAYSIIEQGRVDQILQANPTTRRVVFEEAAGISRYKARKTEAQRKLDRVAQNLARLTDIVDEVETRLNATRSQASKAARYREVSQELKTLWTGLAADECRRLTRSRDDLNHQSAESRREIAELDAALAGLEEQKSGIEDEMSLVEGRIRAVQGRLAQQRERIASYESTVRHQTARQRERDAEIVELRAETFRLRTSLDAVTTDLHETAERLHRFETALTEQRQSMQVREQQVGELQVLLDQAREQISQQRRQRDDLAQTQAAAGSRAASFRSQWETNRRAVAAAQEELAELEERAEAAVHQRDELTDRVEQARYAAAEAAARAEELQAERMRLLDEQGDSEKSLTVMREQRMAWDARVQVLEDLERKQEGVGLGVRDILKRARTIDAPPWNSIVGCVGDLLDVPLEHAALAAVALGERAELVVTRNRAEIVSYLNGSDGRLNGRVGFIEAASTEDAREPCDLAGEPGVVVRADRLVAEPDEVAGLARRLLAGTWIVDSLDDALRLSELAADGTRFVTLQGELLDERGVLFAGAVPTESSIVSRKSELRQLRIAVTRLDDEITEQLRELAALGADLTGIDGDLEAANRARREAADRLAEAKAELHVRAQACEQVLKERDRARAELDGLLAENRRATAELANAEREAADCERRINELEDSIRSAEQDTNQLQKELQNIRDEVKREQLELAKHEERVVGLRDVQERLERDQAERGKQEQESAARLAACLESRAATALHVLNTEAAMAEVFSRIESLDAEMRDLERDRQRVRSLRADLSRRENDLQQRRRAAADGDHARQIELRELTHQLATLEERIREEYQVSLEDLVRSGVSAYDDWLQNREADASEDGPPPETEVAYETVHAQMEERVQRLRRKLKSMGGVNTDALQDLDELETRYDQLSGQLRDLEEARTALDDIIRRINTESRRMFLESFESVREHFRDLFRKLFGGGEADIVLEDPDDVLECGIDIVARPPGKELRSLSLLSGGEKTLTAVALLFAMFKSNPSPYCILDEVDAALDEANVERFAAILKEFVATTQFIVITHRKRTMAGADVLYGVTMEQAGVSKRMSVRFEDVTENGEFRTSNQAA